MAKTQKRVTPCEATRTVPAQVKVKSDDPNYPYRVCKAVAERLKACALTPLEWYRLAAIHGPENFLLHEDMYDDAGNAMQPGMPVPKKPRERPPSFQDVRNDMEELLDYFFTRRDEAENERMLEALGRFDKGQLFKALERRLGKPPRKAVEGWAYMIFQRVLPELLAARLVTHRLSPSMIDTKWLSVRPRRPSKGR
jgi:hypothetical protein